ncbi:MAG: hypothetical protein Ct9H90mP24_3870 [Methanobacteriota archaeon]|nr:MAG: hypothetical protein Ct9H90mP24_3870 [Euryarchaeota archaeon]
MYLDSDSEGNLTVSVMATDETGHHDGPALRSCDQHSPVQPGS